MGSRITRVFLLLSFSSSSSPSSSNTLLIALTLISPLRIICDIRDRTDMRGMPTPLRAFLLRDVSVCISPPCVSALANRPRVPNRCFCTHVTNISNNQNKVAPHRPTLPTSTHHKTHTHTPKPTSQEVDFLHESPHHFFGAFFPSPPPPSFSTPPPFPAGAPPLLPPAICRRTPGVSTSPSSSPSFRSSPSRSSKPPVVALAAPCLRHHAGSAPKQR